MDEVYLSTTKQIAYRSQFVSYCQSMLQEETDTKSKQVPTLTNYTLGHNRIYAIGEPSTQEMLRELTTKL